ncbi:MAG: hypothetical protein KME64_43620 [Scytonematopsis contorta HA4267-MV1]|nr:hypothetical protein [Scytonematopsis contorta HA4267-MV1]
MVVDCWLLNVNVLDVLVFYKYYFHQPSTVIRQQSPINSHPSTNSK